MCGRFPKLARYGIAVGLMLLNMPTGIPWYYGNLVTYLDSYYINKEGSANHTSGSLWLASICLIFYTMGMVFSGTFAQAFGHRWTVLTGLVGFNVAVAVTYFTMQHSFWFMHVTFGALGGFFVGLVYAMVMVYAAVWFPEAVGMATSVVISSFGGGSLVLNQAITLFLNPDNIEPDITLTTGKYFSDKELVSKVPKVFLVLTAASLVCHIIGFLLLRHHPDLDSLRKRKNNKGLAESKVNDAFVADTNNGVSQLSSDRSYGATNGNRDSYGTDRANDQNHYWLSPIDQKSQEISSNSKDQLDMSSKEQKSLEISKQQSTQAESKCDTSVKDYTTLEMLKTRPFYLLAVTVMLVMYGFVVEINFYKQFGLLYIDDDYFLTLVATLINVVVSVFRIVWGVVVDRIDLKSSLIALTTMHAVTSIFWYFTPMINRWFYLVWTLLVQAIQSGGLVIFPVLTLSLFGRAHYTSNYGLVFGSSCILFVTSPLIVAAILRHWGYFWLFFTASITSAVGTLLSIFLPSAK